MKEEREREWVTHTHTHTCNNKLDKGRGNLMIF